MPELPPRTEPLEFEVCAGTSLTLNPAAVAALRGPLSSSFGGRLSVGVLKQVDDQALVALQAMKDALADPRLVGVDCSAWGLVAAARSIGRKKIIDSLHKFREQGAWSMSPHIIPHCSLHSVSGLISQALELHGPNIGAGGWAGAEKEAIWAGLSMLFGDGLPGVWIVLTGWKSEEITPSPDNVCQSAVLGLRRGAGCCFSPGRASAGVAPFSLERLVGAMRAGAAAGYDLGAGVCQFSFRQPALGVAA